MKNTSTHDYNYISVPLGHPTVYLWLENNNVVTLPGNQFTTLAEAAHYKNVYTYLDTDTSEWILLKGKLIGVLELDTEINFSKTTKQSKTTVILDKDIKDLYSKLREQDIKDGTYPRYSVSK